MNALDRARRWHPAEALPWLFGLLVYFVFPGWMALATQSVILCLFALSLDLVIGFAGIVTLGHAAFFGLGAYTSGLLSSRLGWAEPLSGLALAASAAGLYALMTGWLLLRYHGVTLLMLTLASTILLQQLANAAPHLTGGFDGLTGIQTAPLFGIVPWDLWYRHQYAYALAILFVCLLLVRRLIHAPFGRSLIGIRDNPLRMGALGVEVHHRRVAAYTVGGALAGLAGALFAQTSGFLTLDVFGLGRSTSVLIVLVLGGVGRLYGAFLGAVVYSVVEHLLARISPEFWQFGVGLVLVVAVQARRGGLLALAEAGWNRLEKLLARRR